VDIFECVYKLEWLLVGVGTKIDPTLCRADRMVGQVLGAVGALPDIFIELEISYFLLRRLLGVRTEGDKKGAKVSGALVTGLLYFWFARNLWVFLTSLIFQRNSRFGLAPSGMSLRIAFFRLDTLHVVQSEV